MLKNTNIEFDYIHYPNECGFRLFKPKVNTRFVPRPKSILGWKHFFNSNLDVFVDPRPPPNISRKPMNKQHIVFFSHGIGGNADSYLYLLRELVSSGYTVCAIEHEDGSAAYAEDFYGTEIKCKYSYRSREEEIRKNLKEMLTTRHREVLQLFERLFKKNEYINYSLLGHSLGASTMLCVSQTLDRTHLSSVILYDVSIEALLYFYVDGYNGGDEFMRNCLGSVYLVGENPMPTIKRKLSSSKRKIQPILLNSLLYLNFEQQKRKDFFKAFSSQFKFPKIENVAGLGHLAFSDIIQALPFFISWLYNLGSIEDFDLMLQQTKRFLLNRAGV